MKKYQFGFLCLFVCLSSSGQEFSTREQRKLSISLQGGRSVTRAFGPEVDKQLEPYISDAGFLTDPILYEHESITVSAICKLRLSKLAFAKSGLGFLEKGTKIENWSYVYPMNVKNRYLTFPLFIGIDPLKFIFPDERLSLSAEGGITPSLPIYAQHYAPWGPGYSPVKEHRVIFALQWGATLEIAITERIHFVANYSGYRDLNDFYFNPDKASGSPTGRAMFFKGYWVTGGIGYRLK